MRLRRLKLKRTTRRLIASALVLLVLVVLSTSRGPSTLETVLARGTLNIVTRPGPTTYFEDAKGGNGFDYLLAREFASSLGVDLHVTTTTRLSTLFLLVGGPKADFAAANLTITPERQNHYRFSTSYADVVQSVIYRRGEQRPRAVADLVGKNLVVVANSSHEERLRELQLEQPELKWYSLDLEMIDLMDMVNNGDADAAIVDSIAFSAHRNLYPRVRLGFEITQPQQLAWVFPLQGEDSLIQAANRFIEQMRQDGRLEQLYRQFFDQKVSLSAGGSQLFIERVNTRLATFEEMFRKVAEELSMDWHLLAAIAYQESHWDPKAVSPTGVRGLMMLTRDTAREMGVKNRIDPEQSLRGGALYFLKTRDRLPADITDPDRTWMALAAYNVGLGHLEDARVLTDRAGKDPDKWQEVREFLPLLQRKIYYSTVRHGYARGREPVNYVANVRKFETILQAHSAEKSRQEVKEPDQPVQPSQWDEDSMLTL